MIKIIGIFLFTGLMLSGCEKAVHFDLENAPPKLVVEATIENGQPPIVYLSKSMNYFSSIDLGVLA